MSWRKFLSRAWASHSSFCARRLIPHQYQCAGIGLPQSQNIQSRLASTRKTIPGGIGKLTRREEPDDANTWHHEEKDSWNTFGDEDADWQPVMTKQRRPRKNISMTQYALDVISPGGAEQRTDLSVRPKPKNHGHGDPEGRKNQFSKGWNVQRDKDDGFGGFEDIDGEAYTDDNDYDAGAKNGNTSSYFRTYREKTYSLGQFMIQSNGYTNSCMIKVLRNRTKQYDAATDNANVAQLVDCLANNPNNVPLNILTSGVRSLCRVPVDKLDALVGLELPFLLPKVACQSAQTLSSDAICDTVLAMSHLHCKLSSDEVDVMNKECVKQLNLWDLRTMLLVSDCWLHLCLNMRLSYHEEMLEMAARDVNYGTELTGQDVVQLFYILRVSVSRPKIVGEFPKLLRIVADSLNSLTWFEIHTLCSCVVKVRISKAEIKQDRYFLDALSSKLIDGLQSKDVEMFCVIGIMRCFARCYYEDQNTFDAIAEYLTPIIEGGQNADPRYTQVHMGNVAMAFGKVRMFHKPLMEAIANYVLYSDKRNRTKDVNMFLWAFGRLYYKPEEHSDRFFQQLIQELRFKEESRQMYPETFLGSMVSLTFLGYYPDTLINEVFSPGYLQICEEHMRQAGLDPLCRHLFTLDCSVALECPDYNGNRLPERFIKMYKNVRHGSEIYRYKMEMFGRTGEIIRLLREMLGHHDYVKIHPVLPHIKNPADIEVHLDSQCKPVMPHSFQSDDSLGRNLTDVSIPYYKLDEFVKEAAETSNAQGMHRIAVLVYSPLFYLCNTRQLLGVHIMKKRQLKKVGYKVAEIPHFEWRTLNQKGAGDKAAKKKYLWNKLEEACKD